MLSLLTLFSALGAGLCTGSCTREDLLAPVAVQAPATLLVTSDSLCARVTVTVSGSSTISSTWPSTLSCTTKLVLIKGSTPKWAGSTRKLSLFIKLTNKSGGTLQMPVRLYLPTTGVTVLTPAGTPASTVVALNPDSSEAGGGRVWFTGGTGTLANNASTVLDTLVLTLASPASQVRFSFVATANTSGGGGTPPPLPNTTATVPDDSLHTIRSPADTSFQYFRTIAEVQFRRNATPQQIAAFFAKYPVQVVGGSTWSNTYVVMYPDPGNTWTAVIAQLRLFEAEPGVLQAMLMSRDEGPPILHTRYPSDGARMKRENWLQGQSDTVWAMNAIRAPQAWGCENGRYGGPLVRVGVMDFGFDEGHPDLLPSLTTPMFKAGSGVSILETTSDQKKFVYHGTMAAGLLTGAGNNDTGAVGAIWKSDLRLYDLNASNTRRNYNERTALEAVLQKAAGDNLKVVAMSIDVHIDPDTFQGSRSMAKLIGNIKDFLDSAPNTLVVKSSGDGGDGSHFLQVTTTQAKNLRSQGLLAALMSLRDSGLSYKNRIVIVGGTTRDTRVSNVSTLITGGGTDIMAPGERVAVLGLRESGYQWSGNLRLDDGTSISAPLVAGVAAQLLSMDPTLTPAQVKDYLVRSAAYSLDPISGVSTLKSAVAGAPETIYQLDAYGALVTLSWERPNTPACGLMVYPDYVSSYLGLIVLRQWLDTIVVSATPLNRAMNVSIAQGGRLIAVSVAQSGQVKQFTKNAGSGAWVPTSTLSGLERRSFLERDTVDAPVNSFHRILHGETTGSVDLDLGQLVPGQIAEWAQFSPDAKHVIIGVAAPNPDSRCYRIVLDAVLVTLPGGSAAPPLVACPAPADSLSLIAADAAWDPGGNRFILAVMDQDLSLPYEQRQDAGHYQAYIVNGSSYSLEGGPLNLGPFLPGDRSGTSEGHTTSATGATMTFEERYKDSSNGDSCYLVTRDAHSPFASRMGWAYALSDPYSDVVCQTPVQTNGARRRPLALQLKY